MLVKNRVGKDEQAHAQKRDGHLARDCKARREEHDDFHDLEDSRMAEFAHLEDAGEL